MEPQQMQLRIILVKDGKSEYEGDWIDVRPGMGPELSLLGCNYIQFRVKPTFSSHINITDGNGTEVENYDSLMETSRAIERLTRQGKKFSVYIDARK